MANPEHVAMLRRGASEWNAWRKEHPEVTPDLWRLELDDDVMLANADLSGARMDRAQLKRTDLRNANLAGASLECALIHGAYLGFARLAGADLSGSVLTDVSLDYADLTGCQLQCEISGGSFARAVFTGARVAGANIRSANLFAAGLAAIDLTGANLSDSNLTNADLSGAILRRADLTGANLTGTNLEGAQMDGANLTCAHMVRTRLKGARLSDCQTYGLAAWDVELDATTVQSNLRVGGQLVLDNVQVAQFLYLLLNNQAVREVIDTITSKAVLILGRFTPDRKAVLDAVREELRRLEYVPLLFDFERPTDRDFTETIMTLAGMCRFIIADITNPRSSPLELQATVPNYMVPFVPIIQRGETPFSMFQDLGSKFDWVLDPLEYDSAEALVRGLQKAVIAPALAKQRELSARKGRPVKTRSLEDYV
jgi:uncharacterized protein YjbI with pentapeptide repeats